MKNRTRCLVAAAAVFAATSCSADGVTYTTLAEGSTGFNPGNATEPGAVTVRQEDEYRKRWAALFALTNEPPRPPVDLTKNTVVIIYSGTRYAPALRLQSLRAHEDELAVRASRTDDGKNCLRGASDHVFAVLEVEGTYQHVSLELKVRKRKCR